MRGGVGWAAAVGLALAAGAAPALAREPGIGQPAPEFHARLAHGKDIALSDFKGQVVVLNFWAVWCGPCRKELPLLEAYYRIQRPHGLTILAVLADDTASPGGVEAATKGVLQLPIAWRFHGGFPSPRELPTSYVIDRAGIVRAKQVGPFDLDALNATLVPLLQEPSPEGDGAPARTAAN